MRALAADFEHHYAELPSCRLHYAVTGEGPPLVVVPATVSLIEDWQPLLQFMGRRYRTYFFELPGHGGSTPLNTPFTSDALAEVIEQFADRLGLGTFGLLGFSFGGILALKALKRLGPRVSRIGLLSPCIGTRALTRPRLDRFAVAASVAILSNRVARRAVVRLLHDRRSVRPFAWFMRSVGGFESPSDLGLRLMAFTEPTLAVLISQIREILTTEPEDLAGPYPTPCFFGMSAHDPLLDYGLTERFVRDNFADLVAERFDWPYHAPPRPLTLVDYDRDYEHLLEADAMRVSPSEGEGINHMSPARVPALAEVG